MADVILVKNVGSDPFDVRYNSRSTIIPPQDTAIVDVEAAKLWFGDWDARNVGKEERHQFRSQELARLKGLYGAHYDDDMRQPDPRIPEPLFAEQKWDRNQPRIELYEQDGTRIISVLDDPKGDSLPLEDASSDVLARTIEQMQKQLEDMNQRLLKAQEAQSTMDIPTDSPETAPQRRRGAVKVDAALDREEVG